MCIPHHTARLCRLLLQCDACTRLLLLSRDGGVIVASFYLPVTLTKRTGSSVNGARGSDEWTAEWDHEQLIALQVGDGTVIYGTVIYGTVVYWKLPLHLST